MIHWRRGDRSQARRCYDEALADLQKTQPIPIDLRLLQAEAARLLNVGKPEKTNR